MTAPRVSLETLAAWLLATAAFVFPILAAIAPLGITVEFMILGAGILPFVIQAQAWRRLPRPALLLPATMVIWALLSSLWADDAPQAAVAALRLAGAFALGLAIFAAGLALPTTAMARFRIALLTGFGLVAVALLVDQLAGHLLMEMFHLPTSLGETHPIKRGITVLALLIWPVRMVLRRSLSPLALTALTTVIVAVIFLGHSSTAKLATAIGIAVTLASLAWPRRTSAMVGALLVTVTLSMPLAAYSLPSPRYTFQHWAFLAPSAHHRVTIWGFTAQRIAEHPLLGWGMNASRGFPGGDHEVVVRRYVDGIRVAELTESMLPLHPHNAVLQLWLELGVIGAVTFGTFLAWLLSRIGRVPIPMRGDLTVLATAAFIMAAGSFGFWQGWWQASLWLTAVFAILAARSGDMGLSHAENPSDTAIQPPERNESLRP